MSRATKKWKLAIILLIVLFLIAVILSLFLNTNDATVTDETITIEKAEYNPGNMHQTNASVKMFSSDGKLLFFPWISRSSYYETKYHSHLCSFGKNGVDIIMDKKAFDKILGCSNGYVYYAELGRSQYELYCYHLKTKVHIHLGTVETIKPELSYIGEDGSLYIATDYFGNNFIKVHNSQLLPSDGMPQMFELNGLFYTLESSGYGVAYYDADGSYHSLSEQLPFGFTTITPCKQGLLVHIHGNGEVTLYLISAHDNELILLFSVGDAVAETTVNIYNDNAYVSFYRYGGMGFLGPIRRKNDEVAGTYRIDLENHSVKKISDSVYNGLYVFDNTGIFACDEYCNIYKLDSDGNVIITLLAQ